MAEILPTTIGRPAQVGASGVPSAVARNEGAAAGRKISNAINTLGAITVTGIDRYNKTKADEEKVNVLEASGKVQNEMVLVSNDLSKGGLSIDEQMKEYNTKLAESQSKNYSSLTPKGRKAAQQSDRLRAVTQVGKLQQYAYMTAQSNLFPLFTCSKLSSGV